MNAEPRQEDRPGCWKCSRKTCEQCPLMLEGDEWNIGDGTVIKITGSYSCNTKNALYRLHCLKHVKDYSGQTFDMKSRLRGHLSKIRNRRLNYASARHFCYGDCLEHLRFQVTSSVSPHLKGPALELALLQKEAHFMQVGKTVHPHGINSKAEVVANQKRMAELALLVHED